jgi:serine/threonine-protein kinase
VGFDAEAVFASPFDPATLKFTGPSVPITGPTSLNHGFDIAADGLLAYVPSISEQQGRVIVWVRRDGSSAQIMDTRAAWIQPRVSPDGRRIVMRKVGNECELWVYDLERESLARITGTGDNHFPVWSPDGRRIAYRRSDGVAGIYVVRVDGVREDIARITGAAAGDPASWTAAGDLLLFDRLGRGTARDIYVLPMGTNAEPIPYLATPSNEESPTMHPSGRWVAYSSNETGAEEILVRRYPDTGEVWLITNGGGSAPLWSSDGRALYYVAERALLQIGVETTPSFRAGKPAQVADGVQGGTGRPYDVTADGRIVTARVPGGTVDLPEIRVLLNWESEMARVSTAPH